MEAILQVQHTLYQIHEELNQRKFQGALPEAVIVILTDKKAQTKHGHMTLEKVWDDNGTLKYELGISAYTLNRPYEEICCTILHEMCHLLNLAKDIKDCTKGGKHNKEFEKAAQNLGMIVEKSDKHGYAHTTLNLAMKKLVNEFMVDKNIFNVYKPLPEVLEKEKKPSMSITYECPNCLVKFKSKKDFNVICGDCEVEFEKTYPQIDEDGEVETTKIEDNEQDN